MNTDHDTHMAWLKVAVAWIGAAVGGLTLSTIVLILTAGFTALQIYVLVRKLRKDIRMERLEAQLMHKEHE